MTNEKDIIRYKKQKNKSRGILRLSKNFHNNQFCFTLPKEYRDWIKTDIVDVYYCIHFGGVVLREHNKKYDCIVSRPTIGPIKAINWNGKFIDLSANTCEDVGFYEDDVKVIKYEINGEKMLVIVPYWNGKLIFRCDKYATFRNKRSINKEID